MSDQLPFFFEDFGEAETGLIIGPENELAIKWLRNWPDWPTPSRFLNIFGPASCGKSRLGRIHSERTGAQILTSLINWEPQEISSSHFILDDISLFKDWSEEALFFLYQAVTSNSGTILFLSVEPLSKMAWKLDDLRSRFRSVNAQEIQPLSEISLRPLLEHHFTQRQCIVSQKVLNFLLPRVRREYFYIEKLVFEIDTRSLNNKQPVSLSLVKQVLSEMSGDKF